jgi:hypothetical protein
MTDFDASNMIQEKDHGLEFVRYKVPQDLSKWVSLLLILLRVAH